MAVLRDNPPPPPQDLDLLYLDSFDYISHSGEVAQGIATIVLSCVLHMIEPRRPQALLTAIAAGKALNLDLILSLVICANIVVLDAKCDVLRTVFLSVSSRFLESPPGFSTCHGPSHSSISLYWSLLARTRSCVH